MDFCPFVAARQPWRQKCDTQPLTSSSLPDTCIVENATDLTTKESIPLTTRHYLKHLSKLTEQFSSAPESYRDKKRQRIYLKDIDCPEVWQNKLKDHIPSSLFYLNESTGDINGPGSLPDPTGRLSRGIARAGDLMSSLPPEMRAENLMCYIGHEGTYTPSHREMCASLGQNIMVNASDKLSEDGQPERPGSSLWFMTESKDRHLVSEYWLSILGHDIEVENHFAQLIAWKKAPFKTYVVEQRLGDFLLIPPLAPHQVWNRGTRTMKIAWNRTTVETLELALEEALPNSRIVCRDEQYKNKAIVYYTLQKYSALIKAARAQVEAGGEQAEAIQTSVKIRQVQRDFKRLFSLHRTILLSEMFSTQYTEHPEYLPFDSNVTCSYCRCNIFNRFLSCKSCKNMFSNEIEDPYDVCMDCYCMGRSCGCQSGYTWVEQWKWKDLVLKYEEWRVQIIDIDGQVTETTPLPLPEERRYLGKKTLAHVCQDQLRTRPFVDIKNPQPEEVSDEDEEAAIDEYGHAKKPKKKPKQWLNNHKSCHCCLHRHPKWKMAFCSNCDLGFCFGTLFRGHDLMPINIMQDFSWKCPHCRKVCNTGHCRRDPRQHPYEPKGTLLGHDTKKVADPRSVECLVDFSVSNLNWMRKEQGMDQSAMQRRLQQAELDKLADPSLDARYIDEDHPFTLNGIVYAPAEDANGNTNETGGTTSGYVNPRTVLQDPDADTAYVSYYPDPGSNGEIPRLGQKHSREDSEDDCGNSRRKNKSKKQKKNDTDTPQAAPSKNVSSKEYQKEMQRRLLDEARREDRYNLVAARIKNQSKIVKLVLNSQDLEMISHRPVPERTQATSQEVRPAEDIDNQQSILQSDVLPQPAATMAPVEKTKAAKVFRYRVEKDDSYTTKRRNPGISAPAKPGRPRGSRRFEEVTLESDEDINNDYGYDGVGEEYTGQSRGRTSTWLARKNQGEDEDLPTELPTNFRDGDLRPDRERERERARRRTYDERKKAMPGKPGARIRPVGRPPKKRGRVADMSNGNEDAIGEDDDQPDDMPDNQPNDQSNDLADEELLLAQQAAAAAREAQRTAAAAREAQRKAEEEREAQENLRTKISLFETSDDNASVDGFLEDLTVEEESLSDEPMEDAAQTPRTGPPQIKNSLLSRPGMSGKKIKITSALKRDSEVATVATTPSSFTSINRTVDLSSGSEDDVPANPPPPKRPVGRPPGRPSMVPTRGTSTPKRGRGRPRKNP